MGNTKHTIVIGGGIAGLLAAHVLLAHSDQVTLLERDTYPQEPIFRPGVPQGRQVHALLLRGQRTLEALVPGLKTKLLARGAFLRDYGNDTLYYYGGLCPNIPPVLQGWNCSRPLLEWQLRQELLHAPAFSIRERCEVTRLLFDPDTQSVYGVQVRERTTNTSQELVADLVIDASGSSSQAPQWLEDMGYAAPHETVVNASLGYATRFYERPAQARYRGIAIQATQGQRRGGALMEIEGGRWMVVLSGNGDDHPPTDEESYLAFAESLPEKALSEAIRHARPLSPIYGYRRTENRRRHFERLSRFPAGFLVLGDAACSFNPLYGQGMTLAALEAQALDAHLRKHGYRHGLLFQKRLARLLTFPWRLATASDVSILETGTRPNWTNRYIERVIALLPHDPIVLLTFLQVVHMIRSPFALMHPGILLRVFRSLFQPH